MKKGESNNLECKICHENFCYICNKSITGDIHFQEKETCRAMSNPYDDL